MDLNEPQAKMLQSNVSQISLPDSGIGSLNSSHDYNELQNLNTSTSEQLPSHTLSKSDSCPTAPQRSVSSESDTHMHRQTSTSTHLKKSCSTEADVILGTQVPSLAPVPEAGDISPNKEWDSRSRAKSVHLLTEFKSLSLTSISTGVPTSQGASMKMPSRVRSASLIKRKPKLGKINKALSSGDTDEVINPRKLLTDYRPLPSLYNSGDEEVGDSEETSKEEAEITKSDDFDAYYIEEDLTREELPKIASRLNPSKSCRLSCILLKKTHVWDDVCQSHPYAESQERILRVLEKWFENVPSSPQNRRTLASACESVDQGRLASCIAKKAYYDET